MSFEKGGAEMDRNQTRVGIIGYGAMGEMWAGVLSRVPEVTLAAIAEPNKEQQLKASTAYGCKTFSHAGAMFINSRFDVAIITTHVPLHYLYVLMALEQGCHVICEKPMASAPWECDTMIAEAKRQGLKLAINHQSIFSRAVTVAEEKIAAGDIGELYAIKAYGKGRIGCSDQMEIAGHLLHLMWYFAKGVATEVFGDVTINGCPVTMQDAVRIKDVYPAGRDSGIGAGNRKFGYWKFSSGIRGELHLDELEGAPNTFDEKLFDSRNYGYCLELLGTKARMQLYLPRVLFFNSSPLDDWSKKATPWVEVDPSLREEKDPVLMRRSLEQFLTAIKTGGNVLVSGEVGRMVMDMSFGIDAAHLGGYPLSLPLADRKHPFAR